MLFDFPRCLVTRSSIGHHNESCLCGYIHVLFASIEGTDESFELKVLNWKFCDRGERNWASVFSSSVFPWIVGCYRIAKADILNGIKHTWKCMYVYRPKCFESLSIRGWYEFLYWYLTHWNSVNQWQDMRLVHTPFSGNHTPLHNIGSVNTIRLAPTSRGSHVSRLFDCAAASRLPFVCLFTFMNDSIPVGNCVYCRPSFVWGFGKTAVNKQTVL